MKSNKPCVRQQQSQEDDGLQSSKVRANCRYATKKRAHFAQKSG